MSICQTYQYNIKLLSYIDQIMKIVNNINHYINFKRMKHNINDMNNLIKSIDIINEINIEIRNIIFYGLGVIETKLKTELAYYHVLKYGNHGYLNQSHFDKSNFHTIFIEEILKKVNKEKNQMIENHFSRYDDDPPLYKIIEILSFGQISKFYSNMILRDRKYFSRENYNGIDINILSSWFKFLVEIRNICAHGMPLLSRKILFPPKKLKKVEWDSISNKEIEIIFFVMKIIIDDPIEFNKIKIKLINLLNGFSDYRMHSKLETMLNRIKNL